MLGLKAFREPDLYALKKSQKKSLLCLKAITEQRVAEPEENHKTYSCWTLSQSQNQGLVGLKSMTKQGPVGPEKNYRIKAYFF